MPDIEFMNPNRHEVVLVGPDKQIVKIKGNQKVKLSDFFKRYVPRYLKIVDTKYQIVESKPMQKPAIIRPRRISLTRQGNHNDFLRRRQIVGKTFATHEQATSAYKKLLELVKYPVSNDIGVGILSFNRLNSIKRLIESIRHFKNNNTTIFISDESTDESVIKYLSTIKDMVVIQNKKRLGIAGNTNRLMRCLSRFKYKLLLNDDVEVLCRGWDTLYPNAMEKTKIFHFCMRQPGVYGARANDGVIKSINGLDVVSITDKPHGAVIAFNQEVFQKVGYFDEQFGIYGMEHVDWSSRVEKSGIQPRGYHDVLASDKFFRIHPDKSAVENRIATLNKAKQIYKETSSEKGRIYVDASKDSEVKGVSYIVPFRGLDRNNAIRVVIQNIKAQLFPCIDIILVEQDSESKIKLNDSYVRYFLAKNRKQYMPFNKAMAFNTGVKEAYFDKLILHDADMLVDDGYTNNIYNMLTTHNSVHIGKFVYYLSPESTNKLMASGAVSKDSRITRLVNYFEGGSLGCHFNTYFNIGGFNEDFEGYGNEDTEFYNRLSNYGSFCSSRTESFLHLHHGRTAGWQICHERNKLLERRVLSIPMDKRVKELNNRLKSLYSMETRNAIKS